MKGLSNYIDELANNTISGFFREAVPMNVGGLGEYVDFFAFGVIMVFTGGYLIAWFNYSPD